jgi:two-component system NarL family sensor kinase
MRSKSSRIVKFAILLFFLACNFSFAQTIEPAPAPKDIAEIKKMPASADKVIQLIRHARNPRAIYNDEIKRLVEEALQTAQDLKKDDLIVGVISTKAIIELGLGNQEAAIAYIKQAETYLPKLIDAQAASLYGDLARIYNRTGNPEKASFYFDKIEALTKDKPSLLFQRIINLRNKTNLEVRAGNYEKVKSNYELAIKLSKESNNPALLKDTRFAYANTLLNLRKDDEAFSILKDLIPELENTISDKTGTFLEILSRNYEKTGDYKNAFIYSEKAFNLTNATVQQKGNNINRMILLSFLLKNYSNFDSYYLEHKKYGMDQNSLHAKKQFQLAEGRYFDARENFRLAKNNYLKALKLTMGEQIAPNLDVEILTGLANIYARENKIDSASFYFKKAETTLRQFNLAPAMKLIYANAIKNFSQYKPVGQDSLIKNLEQEMHLRDTLHQMRLSKITDELETKYRVTEKQRELELAKKQQQLQVLEIKQQKQKNWIIIISSIIGAFIFAGIAYLLHQKKESALIIYNAELNDLKNQHRIDIMNTLTDAQEQEKKRIAERLHDEVGAMLSIAKLNINTLREDVFTADSDAEKKLQVTKKLMSDISETVRNISHNLMPIALERYGFKRALLDLLTAIKTANSLNVEYLIEGLEKTQGWPQNFILSTYRIIQEVLNNAIKHSGATHLFVQIIELDSTVTIYIEDNGKGIEPENIHNDGAGMKLLKTNVDYLSGKLEINGKPNEGTFALIELPIPKPIEA